MPPAHLLPARVTEHPHLGGSRGQGSPCPSLPTKTALLRKLKSLKMGVSRERREFSSQPMEHDHRQADMPNPGAVPESKRWGKKLKPLFQTEWNPRVPKALLIGLK